MSQVQGKEGMKILRNKINAGGLTVIYHGAIANALATMIGHYPWFVTHNYLHKYLPKYDDQLKNLGRNAFIGFTSSVISDTSSNFMRVIKTSKQTDATGTSYPDVIKNIVQKHGIASLFFRGLGVRLFTNGLQGLLFNVLWKYLDKQESKKK